MIVLEDISKYSRWRFLVLHDISCITVKVRPFLNVNEVPSIKLGHVYIYIYIKEIIKKRTKRIFHNILVLTFYCSGGHFKIFPLYKVNTEGDFLRRRKETLLINIHKPSLNDKWL
jgi:hypothetical protein